MIDLKTAIVYRQKEKEIFQENPLPPPLFHVQNLLHEKPKVKKKINMVHLVFLVYRAVYRRDGKDTRFSRVADRMVADGVQPVNLSLTFVHLGTNLHEDLQ